MQPISCTNTHDITYLLNHGIAKNTNLECHENRTTFLQIKKTLNLCLR